MITLDRLAVDESGAVVGISPACRGPQRRRLLDLGVVPGTEIRAVMRSAAGDPIAYDIRGALIALRREQAGVDPGAPRLEGGGRVTTTAPGCRSCSANRTQNLVQLGVSPGTWDYLVALAGNPNTGKSTVFNALTGLRQHTGNWPGKTVTRAEGVFSLKDKKVKVVDLPGTYSLQAGSTDEEVARDFILFGEPDVTLVVVDATRLERNLNLVLQVLEITDRVVVCLNLMDEARRHGIAVDAARLEKELGVPVVPDRRRAGAKECPSCSRRSTRWRPGSPGPRPSGSGTIPPAIEAAMADLVPAVEAAFPGLPNSRWVALRLLNADERIEGGAPERRDRHLRRRDRRASLDAGRRGPSRRSMRRRSLRAGDESALEAARRFPRPPGGEHVRRGAGHRGAEPAARRPEGQVRRRSHPRPAADQPVVGFPHDGPHPGGGLLAHHRGGERALGDDRVAC